jgi:hypothetical protein
VADEWVTQLLRQGDAQVFKKYSQMKLPMKREALGHLNREANEMQGSIGTLVWGEPLHSCPLLKTRQAQYIELVAPSAPVAQLDRASAF